MGSGELCLLPPFRQVPLSWPEELFAHFIQLPGPRAAYSSWAGCRTGVGGMAPSLRRRAACLFTSDYLPPTFFCSYLCAFCHGCFFQPGLMWALTHKTQGKQTHGHTCTCTCIHVPGQPGGPGHPSRASWPGTGEGVLQYTPRVERQQGQLGSQRALSWNWAQGQKSRFLPRPGPRGRTHQQGDLAVTHAPPPTRTPREQLLTSGSACSLCVSEVVIRAKGTVLHTERVQEMLASFQLHASPGVGRPSNQGF